MRTQKLRLLLKRFSARVRKLTSGENFQNYWWSVITAILATIIATYMMSAFDQFNDSRRQREQLIESLESIYIGTNREWLEEQFGSAAFVHDGDDYSQQVYLTELAIVNVFFERSSDSCAAYFVTIRDADAVGELSVSGSYKHLVGGKPLGAFTYEEFAPGCPPVCVAGYITNGVSRTFYGELNYVGSSSNYYSVAVAYLDYGLSDSKRNLCLVPQSQLSEEGRAFYEQIYGLETDTWVLSDRSRFFPNTFGVMEMECADAVMEMISNYRSFDSLQLMISE